MVVARSSPSSLLRWLTLGAVAMALGVLAVMQAGAVGAAAPADCIPINYTTCVSNGTFYTNGNPTSTVTTTAYVVPSYSYGYTPPTRLPPPPTLSRTHTPRRAAVTSSVPIRIPATAVASSMSGMRAGI